VRRRETKADREVRTLTAGLRAAHRRLFRRDAVSSGDSFAAIYSDLEDALYSLYSAIQKGQKDKINRDVGDIIILASRAAEKSEQEADSEVAHHTVGDILDQGAKESN
jgi:hypothetical protein